MRLEKTSQIIESKPWLSPPRFGTDPTTPLHDPPQPTQGGAEGNPHIPITSKHFWPQGATRDFSRYPPNILQQEILQQKQKKSSLATFPEYSHFRPSRNAAGTTLLRERWVFVSWLEHRVRGQELWVLIPALPLNHFESSASHFVLEPVSNFPLGWFSDGKHCFIPNWNLGENRFFHWEYLVPGLA